MHSTSLRFAPAEVDEERPNVLDQLAETIEHVAHLLPAQGPITVFIHHNTLHAFEELPFTEAVKQAAQVFGCHPYLSEDQYRDGLRSGRIRFSELEDVLQHDLGDSAGQEIPCFGTRFDLRLAMMQFPLRTGPDEELAWYVAETDALRRIRPEASAAVRAQLIAETRHWVMRDLRYAGDRRTSESSAPGHASSASKVMQELLGRVGDSVIENWSDARWESITLQALWRLCCEGIRHLPPNAPTSPAPTRDRDWLLTATGVDTDLFVHERLIRFVSAFLDQGLAPSEMPLRNAGLYGAFCMLYGQHFEPPTRWTRGLAAELRRMKDENVSPLESIYDSLHQLGVPEHDWKRYLSATLLALRGWAGMVRQVELRGDRVVHPVPEGSLIEFLAVRLILDRFAVGYVARTVLRHRGPLNELRAKMRAQFDVPPAPNIEQRAFLLFQLAQVMGVSPDRFYRLRLHEWSEIMQEVAAFSELERRRVFHLAYERRFTAKSLDAVAIHAPRHWGRPPAPGFQVVCCLDEREESFRRHLEELAPEVETFGAAGFFSVAMYYRGAADAHFTPLCPVVVVPQHWVSEEVGNGLEDRGQRQAKTRRILGSASHRIHRGSRTIGYGTLLTGAVGVLATFPLLARILFPRLAARIRRTIGHIVQPAPATRLQIERKEASCGPDNGHIGYTVEEMINISERLLQDIGLTANFARLVLLIGHGSNSLNNPYNSAYNCGACGGSPGGPNGRAIAHILSDRRVRAGLAQRGLIIPEDTVFVGGLHNTCNDVVTFFDLDRIPASHREEFEGVRESIAATCERNAHERCRRFMSAPLTLSYSDAHQHVEERSEDLAQTRPELGHATNAITIVGRREWSRGLFLDRRAFLTSYDPTQDDADCSILTRILQAVFPVCSGINLEYFFSKVDNYGFGSGTKLPHNLASLLGVMDGAASDLRTGLPWQMVEIHEPVRSQFIIETTPEAMLQIMDRNPGTGRLCRNGWVLLSLLHPETRRVYIFQNGEFKTYQPQATSLPQARSSIDWYRGWRDHLEFSQIEAGALPSRRPIAP